MKIGHGGTLDPLATGVLIIGVGKGTKQLQSFLSCTKTYETVLLFGTATDTYDIVGRVLSQAPYNHVTRERVEKELDSFRGQIMQRPPLYSALRMQGKRLYEYAREGKELPADIEERLVNVESLEIVDWLEPGSHDYHRPGQAAEKEEKEVADQILQLGNVATKEVRTATSNPEANQVRDSSTVDGTKRKRSVDNDPDDLVSYIGPASKRREIDQKYQMSGGLQVTQRRGLESSQVRSAGNKEASIQSDELFQKLSSPTSSDKGPPAVKLRMTVTSGFYVRSLCYDLGKAVGSLGIMAELARTRQGEFKLGMNVFGHDQLSKGEDVWGPKVEEMLGAKADTASKSLE